MLNFSVLINTISVIAGSIIGIFAGNRFPENIKKVLFNSVGLTTLIIGIDMGLKSNNILIVLFSLALGGITGEILKIEEKIGKIASKIEKSEGETLFVKGFISSTVLFIVGPMTILGCVNAGINNDNSLILLKSLLDGISSVIFASVYGFGVMLSSVSIFVVQGLLVTFAGNLSFLASEVYINDFTAVGGLMTIAIGIRILEIKEIKVGNYLPSLFYVVLIDFLAKFF
ncbi:MAG: DUF554 domain-containing protein [Thermotogae bacterium]|nr:DUF554 domain-containing protein [Thermotogota bacterium]MCP5465598.1 DUF554 domain-containing protein [Thermotogota bacterium]